MKRMIVCVYGRDPKWGFNIAVDGKVVSRGSGFSSAQFAFWECGRISVDLFKEHGIPSEGIELVQNGQPQR